LQLAMVDAEASNGWGQQHLSQAAGVPLAARRGLDAAFIPVIDDAAKRVTLDHSGRSLPGGFLLG